MLWHSDPDVKITLQKYHDNKAKQPNEAIKHTKAAFETLMTNFRNYLQDKNVAERFEYVGSCYEDVRVNLPVEYDVVIVLKNGPFLQKVSKSTTGTLAPSGFTYLQAASNDLAKFDKAYFVKNTNTVSSQLVKNKFQGFVDNWLTKININNELPSDISSVRRKAHGAAVQIDAYGSGSAIAFSVDLVPSFELDHLPQIEQRESYVAKQYTNMNVDDKELAQNSWRRSYSVQDKHLFSNIDRGSKIRKNILRILKAMVSSKDKPRSDLARITSYHIKTAVLIEHDKYPDSWSGEDLVPRFFGVLAILRDAMKEGVLNDYFSQQRGMQVNLIRDIPEITRNQIRNVLDDFYTKKNSFTNVFG